MNEPITFYHYFNNYSTVIPIIQRDYALGRKGPKEKQVLKRFLSDLMESITLKRRMSLNFIYGIEKRSSDELEFMPIDGQQRLTTLFLFHWFVALKCSKLEDFLGTAKNFTYQTRSSAMDFFATLQCKDKISDFDRIKSGEDLRNHNWYSLEWNNDPTVNSVVEAFDQMFSLFQNKDFEEWWQRLTVPDCPITFRYISINKTDAGQTDDNFERESKAASIYIKMNARGKHLSEFENTKALLHRTGKAGEDFSTQYESRYIKTLEMYASKENDIKGDIGKLSRYIDDYMMQFLINLYNDLFMLTDDKTDTKDENNNIICDDYYKYSAAVRRFAETKEPPYKSFPDDYFLLIDKIFTCEIIQFKEKQFIEYCKYNDRPSRLRFITPVVYAWKCKYDENGIAEWEYFLNNLHFFDKDENTEEPRYFSRALSAIYVLAQKIHSESNDSFLAFLESNSEYLPFEERKVHSVKPLDWKEEHIKAKIIKENNLGYDYFDGIQKHFDNRIRAFLQMAGFWNGSGNKSKLDNYIALAESFKLTIKDDPPRDPSWAIRKLVYLFAAGFMGSKQISCRPCLQKEVYSWEKESDMKMELLGVFGIALDYLHNYNITTEEMLEDHLKKIAQEFYANKDWRAFALTRKKSELFYHVNGDKLENNLHGQLLFPVVKKLDMGGKDIDGAIPYHDSKIINGQIGTNVKSSKRISFGLDITVRSNIHGANADDYIFYTSDGTNFSIYRYIAFEENCHRFEKRTFNIKKFIDKYYSLAKEILEKVIKAMPEDDRNEQLTKIIYWDVDELQKKCDDVIGTNVCKIGHYYNQILVYFSKENKVAIENDTILDENPILLGLEPDHLAHSSSHR